MMTSQVLAMKRAALSRMRSTVPADAGVQTAHARSFTVDSPQPLAAYPAAGAGPIVIASYRVPAGMTGALTFLCIAALNYGANNPDGTGNVVWHIFKNGAPLKGYENIYVQIGSTNQPQPISLTLTQNDLVQVLVEVPGGKVAPAGNPFARLVGFLDFGGIGASGGASTAGGSSSGSSSSSDSSSSSSSTTTTTTTTTTSTGTVSNGSGRTGTVGISSPRPTMSTL